MKIACHNNINFYFSISCAKSNIILYKTLTNNDAFLIFIILFSHCKCVVNNYDCYYWVFIFIFSIVYVWSCVLFLLTRTWRFKSLKSFLCVWTLQMYPWTRLLLFFYTCYMRLYACVIICYFSRLSSLTLDVIFFELVCWYYIFFSF